jgi:outer membrane lipoprotein-sorting protein
MKQMLAAALLVLGASAPAMHSAAAAQTTAAEAIEMSGPARDAALAAASASLNRQKSIKARFMQLAPNGAQSQGDLYLQRPGKLRFAYDAPSPLTIVAAGNVVAVEDKRMREVTRVPLRSTPLFFALKDQVSLAVDARITRVTREGQALYVTARDRKGEASGQITMKFVGDSYELREWTITDGQNRTTRVSLSNVQNVAKHDPALFRMQSRFDNPARSKT